MPFTLAAASGPDVAADVLRMTSPEHGSAAVRVHEDRAVAWAADDPWVSSCDDGEVLVVVDGRLHVPRSGQSSAAELLLARYRTAGEDVARDVLGDFVAVVLDRRRRTLVVARDPLGVRPWYQAASGRRQAGGTEVSSLLALPWVSDAVDEGSALAFLAGRAESKGPTLLRDITTLAPGSTWRAGPGGTTSWPHHAWLIEPEPDLPWEEAVERCRTVLDEAVRCRSAAGSTAAELSGGLDSSAVVGTAVLLGYPDLVVGRLLFEGPSADERAYSTEVIDHWRLEAVSAPPTILTVALLRKLAAERGLPPPDPNFTMFAGVHRELAARGRSSILTGLGGDDAFVDTGLENRLISAVQQRRADVLLPVLRRMVRHPREEWRCTLRPTVRSMLPRARRRPPAYIPAPVADAHGLTERYAKPPVRLTEVRSIDVRANGLTSGHVTANLENAAVVDDLTGVRRSHPFLDPRLIEATYGLDPQFSVRDHHYRALEASAYSDRVPASVAHRRGKAEFSEVVWPTVMQPEIIRGIASGPLVERGWLDLTGFRNVVNDARSGRAHAALPLSRMVALQEWLQSRES